ncbi:MAG TPA: DUF2306 domain-containing protein [Acidimicrobiia bacterium]|nr:DUF2306 domain-containing protein [Acidimicrobiia bacterium]
MSTRALRGVGWAGVWFLIVTVLAFIVIRLSNDVPNIADGTLPAEGEFDRRYAENPILAYLHILPGAIYLLGAPMQISRRFRSANYERHGRVGRVVLVAGLTTGVMALVVGVAMPFGGIAETSASTSFGIYFITALVLAYRAIRSGRVTEHRRWMIRAFAIGVGVGLIRIVIGVGEAMGIGIADSFGAAFWIAFVTMAVVAEIWLRIRPDEIRLQLDEVELGPSS